MSDDINSTPIVCDDCGEKFAYQDVIDDECPFCGSVYGWHQEGL